MKNSLIALSFFALVSCGKEKSPQAPAFHLDPQMTSEEYKQKLLENPTEAPAISEIDAALFAGERMMKWMSLINREKKEQGAPVVALTSKQEYEKSQGSRSISP